MTDKEYIRRIFLDRSRSIALEHFEKTAHDYDNHFPDISPVHAECLKYFLSRLGQSPAILDAACGTGLYFDALAEHAGRLLGIDQSAAMLARARHKHSNFETRRMSLIALKDQPDMKATFDGLTCIDALEWIMRDDWLAVLQGFNQVLRPRGHAYITVEIPGEVEILELALPPTEGAVQGEIRVKYWYNHFPSVDDVCAWIDEAGFEIELEKRSEYYRHLILRKTG